MFDENIEILKHEVQVWLQIHAYSYYKINYDFILETFICIDQVFVTKFLQPAVPAILHGALEK